jgi:cytochrome c peroxidase
MNKKLFSACLCFIFIGLASCTDETVNLNPTPVTLDTDDPSLTLGRVLFYDTHLSVNNSISCGSCHHQEFGFADNSSLSRGFENRLTTRNSISITDIDFNSGSTALFWDGRDDNLTNMVLMPVLNHVEMGMSDHDGIVERISVIPYYAQLFEKTFGTSEVTKNKIGTALALFISNIRSGNSAFDLLQFNALEQEGLRLFIVKYQCNSCHKLTQGGYGGTDTTLFKNIGLDVNYIDNGRGNVTHNPADNGKFKVPNLHNVGLSAPYMHDGRFATLNEVLDHYSHGIKNHPNLDPLLRNGSGQPAELTITDSEKEALIAFLNTLTDITMITSKNLSDPFQH